MRACIISNGNIKNKELHLKVIESCNLVICADGGADNARKLGVTPDAIIGDMDSISEETKHYFDGRCEFIIDKDQDRTDTELALSYCIQRTAQEIVMLGCIGARFDHTLANLITMINSPVPSRMIDDNNEILLVDKELIIDGKMDDVVSIIPLTDIKQLNATGLKWKVSSDVSFGWLGVCNRMFGTEARISAAEGKVLVIKSTGI